jgi:septal ring factor EnvC (AmiA/AmiB activator)
MGSFAVVVVIAWLAINGFLKYKKLVMERNTASKADIEDLKNQLKELEEVKSQLASLSNREQDLLKRLKNVELIVADVKKLDLDSPHQAIDFKRELDELKAKIETIRR